MTSKQQQERRKDELDNHWHLDKRVPMSIIVALILQTIYFTIFITKLDSRLGVAEAEIAEMSDAYKEIVEIRVHQEYMTKKLDNIDVFLRNDVEWVKPKYKRNK